MRRDQIVARLPRHVLDDAVDAGEVVRIHPGVYRVADCDDVATRRRAALAYCEQGALSHTDALDLWGLPTAPSPEVHVTVGRDAPQTSRGLRLHRRIHFDLSPPFVMTRDGLRAVRLEQAVIESWPLMPSRDRRTPAIVAVRERRTTANRLLDVLAIQPTRTPGIAQQRRLFALLAAGNHSELEIWGHERVFSDRQLPRSITQHCVLIDGKTYILDRATRLGDRSLLASTPARRDAGSGLRAPRDSSTAPRTTPSHGLGSYVCSPAGQSRPIRPAGEQT